MIHFIHANRGGNPTLLLLHGLGATAESWYLQLDDLSAQGYCLVAPDLPGFGRSPFEGARWSLSRAVKQVIGLMDQLGISRFFIAGISMGGAAALHLAYTYPHRVQGLILLNTFASLKPGSLSEWRYFFRRGWRAFLRKPADQARLVAERVFPAPDQSVYRDLLVESIRSADPKVYRQAMLALARFNFTRRLAKIQTPTLVISGEEDTTIPLKNQRELAKRIPGTDHIVIPNAGHAVIADQPQLVNQNIIRFINRLSSIGQVSLPDG